MRKFILISALLLASASAHAGPSSDRGLVLAAADTPAATTTDTAQPAAEPTAQPLPPATDSAKDGAKDGAKDSAKPQIADAPKPRASKPRSQARRYEGDEAKARRIAAKYGISW
jgi:hypothetical protein